MLIKMLKKQKSQWNVKQVEPITAAVQSMMARSLCMQGSTGTHLWHCVNSDSKFHNNFVTKSRPLYKLYP